jgi:hypothetical protein
MNFLLVFYFWAHKYKVVVYAPAEMADPLPLFLLYPYMYSVIATTTSIDCAGRHLLMYTMSSLGDFEISNLVVQR